MEVKQCKTQAQKDYYDTLYHRILDNPNNTLFDCYENPSYAKEKAYDYCMNLWEEYGDSYYWVGIISYNIFQFTFAFTGSYLVDGVEKSGLFYITRTKDIFYYV